MWIYIPDQDEKKEPWTGIVGAPSNEQQWWTFELIRHVEPSDMGNASAFTKVSCVNGLLDHQRACTMITPVLESIDPGSLGTKINFLRTKIKGSFRALLVDLAIDDASKEQFIGFSFSSEAFTIWYSAKRFKTDFDFEERSHGVEIAKKSTEKLKVEDWGDVEITTGVTLSSEGYASRLVSDAIFHMELSKYHGLENIVNLSLAVEKLFGFMIGYREKPTKIKLLLDQKYKLGDREYNHEGTLEAGGAKWLETRPPSRFECLHLNGRDGLGVHSLLKKFLANREDFMSRIYAVEFARFFSKNISDKFSVLMPVYEEYLRDKFTFADEQSYIDTQARFFDELEKLNDLELDEFARKHVRIVDSKSPSLKTLILRSIREINSAEFRFPEGLAARIQKRRGEVFHSALDMKDEEILKFAIEVRAVCGLLLLHTLKDLGCDISKLADQYHGLNDLQGFFKAPPPFGE